MFYLCSLLGVLWSVQFSHSVMSDSLWPHESQHARHPCPSPAPGVYSNSCPLSQWCHPAISFYVVCFSSCPQSLPASGSFPMSRLFTWQGQSIGKIISLTRQTFVGKVMSLLFNMLSRLVITFLPRSKHLVISWLQLPYAVILEPPKIKSDTVSTVSPSICHEVMGPDDMILVFWMLSFKPTFYFLLSLSSRGSLVLLCFLP